MRHVVIRDNQLNGWEYGMLRSFERAIVKETSAEEIEIPRYEFVSDFLPHFNHGMRRSTYRKFFPRQKFPVEADVGWYILMGPENYKLDLYSEWNRKIKLKILYLYDTLPYQYPLIKKLFSGCEWDILITSFSDAVEDLERLTGRKWYCIEQAVDGDLFKPVRFEDRKISFSSYGRRNPVLHSYLKEFCEYYNIYYDYTSHDGRHPVEESSNLYKQYAWHIKHSIITFSWPVELTNPQRAGHLHPITCRWFEATGAGTVIAGKAPDNLHFEKYFGRDLVTEIEYGGNKMETFRKLEEIMKRSEDLHMMAMERSSKLFDKLTWNNRVNRILTISENYGK